MLSDDNGFPQYLFPAELSLGKKESFMFFKKLTSVIVIFTLLLAASCGKASPNTDPDSTTASETTVVPSPEEQRLQAMTIEQKVAQLLVAGISGTTPGADGIAAIQNYQVGGIILFGRNVSSSRQLTELTNQLKALNTDYIPLFLCVDEEGGRVSRMPPEIADISAAYTYGQQSDPSLLKKLGQTLGAECSAFGFNLDFAPVMDVFSDPNNTVIGDRSYGSDPRTVAEASSQVAAGLQDAGIIAAGKHFPGHGDTATDSHLSLPIVNKTKEQWEQNDAIPFQKAIDTGIPIVMVGHILMPQLDPNNPATLSHIMVTDILREEMGFDGVICTDDLTMGAITEAYGIGEAAVRAVEAGCDLLLVCHEEENLEAVYTALLSAVESGRISEQRLNESVLRILSLKTEYGLTNEAISYPDIAALNRQIEEILP